MKKDKGFFDVYLLCKFFPASGGFSFLRIGFSCSRIGIFIFEKEKKKENSNDKKLERKKVFLYQVAWHENIGLLYL